ncbi:conserved Plasmodium protein, unknown function [Babesia microti strain RI]|uniref:CCZ1/INTU/HSP4 first Longin domain-containing protein n=1 Tax=Babesia microti (strain RI) TaxID=1133968 RepID=A0A1N6LXM4_BABMR|nr:conserved Plasmodium protein, unknown function [Babesia microti strain RI]SIO73613.1 conserved Plasmodium protein, unknown function [Babesia microti strain RI]|eukprot:XP_021337697.1 conserved Plasmodium protein, unknown function [Babesia microti strain RI]
MKSENYIGLSSTIVFDISIVHPDKHATDDQLQEYKLLFWHPHSNFKELCLHSGLIEGLIRLGRSFGSVKPVEIIKTKFFTIALHEWEKDLFVAMDFKNDSKNLDINDQLRNGTALDFKLKNIITTFASTFKLLHGSPRDINRQTLQTLLNSFLPAYLSANHPLIDLSKDLDFIYTVILNPKICLDIELFSTHLLDKFSEIKQLSLVHSGQLVHQGMALEDFRSIYNWLCLQVTSSSLPNNGERKLTPFKCLYEVKDCDYLIGLNGKNLFLPIISVSGNRRYHLSVLKYESLLLIMLLDDSLKYDINTKTLLNSIRESAKIDLGGMKGLYESIGSKFPATTELTMNYVTSESQGSLGPNGNNIMALSLYNLLRNLNNIQGTTDEINGTDNSEAVPICVHNASLKAGNITITSKMDVSNRLHIRM